MMGKPCTWPIQVAATNHSFSMIAVTTSALAANDHALLDPAYAPSLSGVDLVSVIVTPCPATLVHRSFIESSADLGKIAGHGTEGGWGRL